MRDLILATRHDVSPPAGDAALLVDVDLAILGSPAERLDEYERQVRQEYNTEHFRSRYEAAARANLTRSIHQLESSER